jgi:predicted SAM-dependent methyltransferase
MSRARAEGEDVNQPVSTRINLCCGSIRLPGWLNIDLDPGADLVLDLERQLLPLPDASAETLVCISAINYFSRERGQQIIRDVFRVLKPGGVVRFATQDLRILTRHYLERNADFYFQKLPNGATRFPGQSFADKLNAFFYGFPSSGKICKYVYDFETLALLFREAGFAEIEQKEFRQSRIPGVEAFDNRPEQMFFLEAVKPQAPAQPEDRTNEGDLMQRLMRVQQRIRQAASDKREMAAVLREMALCLQQMKRPLKAWQYLNQALRLDPANREAVADCSQVLAKHERTADLIKLYSAYLEQCPTDQAMRNQLEAVQKTDQSAGASQIEVAPRSASLDRWQGAAKTGSDAQHAQACLAWLLTAQNATGDGGVSATYDLLQRRWEVSYPETTGYIIPTCLCYFHHTGDARFRQAALAMGEYECELQWSDGGFGEPVGVYGQPPRVFNTSQVLLGLMALHRETGEGRYLQAAHAAGRWIVTSQEPDGRWVRNEYQGARSYHARTAWTLLELYELTKETKYRDAAAANIRWVLQLAQPNGWFRETSLTHPQRPWTHLIGYTLVGLLETCRLDNADLPYQQILQLLSSAGRNLVAAYERRPGRGSGLPYRSFPGTFGPSWESEERWSCLTGNAQLEFFLRRLSQFVKEPGLVETADALLEDLKTVQLTSEAAGGDPNVAGGLAGSDPVGGGYGTYRLFNWGVKFFADSLLQRILPREALAYLG